MFFTDIHVHDRLMQVLFHIFLKLDAAIKHEDEKYEVLIERKLNLQVGE